MARITNDGQSFILDNRRLWIVGAGLDYARVPVELWAERIAAVRQAGFNTVVSNCPWLVHEPRKGRFHFAGQADIKHFVELCVEAELFVGLKLGPFVGQGYDGGGLPSWLSEVDGIAMREANQPFLERAGMYLRKLIGQVSSLQADKLGDKGLVFVQAEQAWLCTRDTASEAYLGELARHIRENGISVPLFTANAFWAEGPGAIETWAGADDLLPNLRQVRVFQKEAPRVVTSLIASEPDAWGDEDEGSRTPGALLRSMAQVLAAGAQPTITPFHGGTNFGFLGGRMAGRPDGFLTTRVAASAPLGEAGARGSRYTMLKRLTMFASHFGAVFAELDPDYQPVTVAIDHLAGKSSGHGVGIVPLRGAQGRVVFVFAGGSEAKGEATTLLLDHGVPLPLNLGDQSVGWYLIDVDLGGRGWLDFANLCPFALVDRSILVLVGPEKMVGQVSVNESLLEIPVPGGKKPRVLTHKDITLVICNQDQIDATYVDDTRVYVGCNGLDGEGNPIAHPDYPQVMAISAGGTTDLIKVDPLPKKVKATRLATWQAAPAHSQVVGTNPRYASLAGPETLDACGTPAGYGWYRVEFKSTSAGTRTIALPDIGNRMHLFLNGDAVGVLGPGPGSMGQMLDIKLGQGNVTLVGLADHTGRFAEGNDFGRRKGWFGHAYEVKPLSIDKPKIIDTEPVSPFGVRNFIIGQSDDRMMGERQAVWTFVHRKKSRILVQIENCPVPGLFLLNDHPYAFYAGDTGEVSARILIDPSEDAFKRGANELRFAPDPDHENGAEAMIAATTVFECIESLTGDGIWAFARWEAPPVSGFSSLARKDVGAVRGIPCWWRATFDARDVGLPAWFDTSGLSKGQVFLNGENVGRYFTSTADGKTVGPQTRLYLPEPWLKYGEQNELTIFDEHGFDPAKTRVHYCLEGESE